MDKAEYQVILDQLKTLVADQDYDGALELVQKVDWRRVKNIRTLCMVADVYEANEMYEDSKRILLLALKRASIGKSILSRLVELCLQMNDTAGASEYYQDFVKAAPRDAARYLLQYKILKANGASLEEQIDALHDYKESEYTERWAYELAKLYDQAGMTQECIEECDDIILWFSEGVYVVRAMELKMKHTPLTPSQQEKYDHRFETMPELLEKPEEKPARKKKRTEKPEEQPVDEQPTAEEEPAQETAGEEPAHVKHQAQEEEFTSTIDLQSRLSQGLKKVIGGMIHDDEDDEPEEEQIAEEDVYAKVEEDRYAPKLEPEQPAESGVRRDAVVTRPESQKEEQPAEPEFDLSSVLEAQADAYAEGKEDEGKPEEVSPAQEPEQEDEFDLSSVLESEVAGILKEKQDTAAAENDSSRNAEKDTEEPEKTPKPELPTIDLEAAIVKNTEEETKEPEETPEAAAPTIDLEAAIVKNTEEETKEPEETPEAAAPTIDFEAAIVKNTEEETKEPEETPEAAAPTIDLEAAIVKNAEEEIKEAADSEQDEAEETNDLERQLMQAAAQTGEVLRKAPQPDLEQQMQLAAADTPQKTQTAVPEFVPDKTIDLQKEAAKAERPAIEIPHATLDISREAEKEQEEVQKPEEEKKDDAFDLQSILAAEVSDMMANPQEQKKEAAPEEDMLARLEKEADRTIEHQELVKETPQDKRLRIMRAAPSTKLTEEQKRVFTYFAKVPGMDTQILEALMNTYNGAVSKTSRHGNIAIMGRKGTGKTRLTEGLIKALCREFEMSAAKFARISADELNEKDVAQIVSKLSGGFLVIERAGRLTDDTVLKLNQAMEFRTDSMILIIEGEKEEMKTLFEEHPDFAEKFDTVIKIPVFTNDELVTFARTYAGECGYKMDEMGILALYTIIGANQSVEEPVSIAKVKEMVDAAIAKASKGGRKIGRKLSGRQVDRMNRIILYEKDFEL